MQAHLSLSVFLSLIFFLITLADLFQKNCFISVVCYFNELNYYFVGFWYNDKFTSHCTGVKFFMERDLWSCAH